MAFALMVFETLRTLGRGPSEYKMLLDTQAIHDSHPSWWNGVMVYQKLN